MIAPKSLSTKILSLMAHATRSSSLFPATIFPFLKTKRCSMSAPSESSCPHSGYHRHMVNLLHRLSLKIHLKQVHARCLLYWTHQRGFMITKLMHRLADLGDVRYAREVFDDFPDPDVFSWNALIRCYSNHNSFINALVTFRRMQMACVCPDRFTLPYVFKACSCLQAFEAGRQVHGQTFRRGFEGDVTVQNCLVSFYAKCGMVARGNVVFERLRDKTVVSWTSIISGYSQNGQPSEALRIFSEMRKSQVIPDWIALVSVLGASSDMEAFELGESVHGLVIKMGFDLEPDLLVSLTSVYAKHGHVTAARSFFEKMETPSLILTNAMLSGYVRNGYAEEAIRLFHQMITKNVELNSITITSTILACAQTGSLDTARWIHGWVAATKFKNDSHVNAALIDMYSKCGSLDSARFVFDNTPCKDVVVWSSMVMGYGLHGCVKESVNLFLSMVEAGVHPNDVTFLGLLTACNHSNHVKEGWKFFHMMRDYGIEPRHHHYSSLIHLLGRGGHLDQAFAFIKSMPIEPTVSVWGALLSACEIHCHLRLGEYAAKNVFSLDPHSTGHYVQLSNLYASAHLWDRVAKLRILMKEKGLDKDLGFSLI